MNSLSKQIPKVLIHLLFWALFTFVSLFLFSDYYWKENPFLQYFFILILIVYTNTKLLLPYFLRKKMYLLYALAIGVIAFLATQVYCNYFAQCGCSIMKCLSDYLWQTLVPIVFFSFLWILNRYSEKQEEVALMKKEHIAMELQFLKSQINPHVLFNNLNTIYSFSLEKPTAVPKMILMLSDNLKHVLYESNSDLVSLQKELDYIDNYIAFQKIRTAQLKTVNYTQNVTAQHHQIAPLLLINIIENAFKHSAPNSEVLISITLTDGLLTCHCSNKKITEGAAKKANQIGLKNLRKRLLLLYPEQHRLSITESEFYVVTLEIQL